MPPLQISKLVTHGVDRPAALAGMRRALDSYVIRGVQHNAPLLRSVLDVPAFVAGNISTAFLAEHYPTPEASSPDRLPLTPQQEEQLLPPMTPNNYETNTSSCWLGVRVQRAAAAASCVALSTPQRLWQCSCPCIVRAAGALPSLLLPCTTELRWLTSAACFAGLFSCIGGCC